MSMRELARAVGLTEGALYRHFEGKSELVADLFAAEAARLREWLERSARTVEDPWERLDALVTAFVEFGFREAESFRLVTELRASPGVPGVPRVRMPKDLFVEPLAAIARAEGGSFEEPTAVVLMIMGLSAKLVSAVRAGQIRLARDAAIRMALAAARAVVRSAVAIAAVEPVPYAAPRPEPDRFID